MLTSYIKLKHLFPQFKNSIYFDTDPFYCFWYVKAFVYQELNRRQHRMPEL